MKRNIYNFLVHASKVVLWPTQFFSPKMKLFLEGRKDVFKMLQKHISKTDKTLWFHCASLGEYEQGLPIMEALKKEYPNHKLVLSFFSPSGYEVRKNAPIADVVCYLPLDTKKNARHFLQMVHPEMAFFVKYEFWPNYLFELKAKGIRTFLISGVFRKNQSFFRSQGNILREALQTFEHFFLQNNESLNLLNGIGFNNASVSGDTRFDRVSKQLEMDNRLDFMEGFKGDSFCLVCGSTWPEDETVLLSFLNSEVSKSLKVVIAPHKIDPQKIKELQKKLNGTSVLYTQHIAENPSHAQILILDTVGLLSKVYSYADLAYVGGAMGTSGLHNILEPATFGVPIVIGKNYENFPEAKKLEDLKGLFSVGNAKQCQDLLLKLISDHSFRSSSGAICKSFVEKNTGATKRVLEYLRQR